MNTTDYLIIVLIVTIMLFYPLLRKIVSLSEIFVNKYVQKTAEKINTEKPASGNSSVQTILNLKLLAYERMILFVERMKPDSLIPRTLSVSLTCREYQQQLLGEIRKEFEYNLSQQLYLSDNTWTVATNFKNNIITLVNTAAADCEPEKPASELAKKILEEYISSDINTDLILKMIKSDING